MKRKREQQKRTGRNILACLFAPFFAVSGAAVVTAVAETPSSKPIGLYVLLGEDAIGNAAYAGIEEEYGQGFGNVYYYGNVNGSMSRRLEKPLGLGHGANVQRFGVEVGFGEVLSKTQEKSLVLKYAVSGERFSDCVKDEDGFSKILTEAVETYRAADYEIRLKGSVWLGDGEENAAETVETLRAIYKEVGVEDDPIAPVLVGGIKEDDSAVTNRPFVYPLTYELPQTADETLSLGKRIAEELIEREEENSVRVCVGEHGSSDVSYQTFDGETTVTLTADEGYCLSEIYVNGERAEKPTDGRLRFREGRYFVTATFERKPTYSLTVESDISQGVCVIENGKTEYYEGETVRFQVKTSKDYAVESVLFNGEAVFATDGVYSVAIQPKENTISVIYCKEPTEETPKAKPKSGCGAGVGGALPVVALGMGVLFKRKKR